MAVTKGQGNPNWNRDETILAFNLLLELGKVIPPKSDERLHNFSKLLNSLPYHRGSNRDKTFRNVAGISFKLQNLQSVTSGKGLTHVSKMDKTIVEEFGGKGDELKVTAQRILKGLGSLDQNDFTSSEIDEEEEFYEGRIIYALHKKRERDSGLRKKYFKKKSPEELSCSVCGLSRHDLPYELRCALFELHHVVPLAEAEGQVTTKMSDLSLLCACCHRGIHKLISMNKRWFSISEAKKYLCEFDTKSN